MYKISILNFSLYHLLFFFTIYSFIGWLSEVSYAYKNQKKFVNRGFLTGPFCPIYGFGCLILIVFLNYVKHNFILLFIGSVFLTSLLEYVTAIILEYAFKDSWWDYSDDPFNIKGRICLGFSLMWGFFGLVVVKFIHPVVDIIINSIPANIGIILFYSIFSYFILDFVITLSSLIKLKHLIKQLNDIYGEIRSRLKSYNIDVTIFKNKVSLLDTTTLKSKLPNIDSAVIELKQRYEIIFSKLTKSQKRLLKAFPDAKSKNATLIIKGIHSRISSFIQK